MLGPLNFQCAGFHSDLCFHHVLRPSVVFIASNRMPLQTLQRVNLQPGCTKQGNFSSSYIHTVNVSCAKIPVAFWDTVVQLGLFLGIFFSCQLKSQFFSLINQLPLVHLSPAASILFMLLFLPTLTL